jgi:hypothetical protein
MFLYSPLADQAGNFWTQNDAFYWTQPTLAGPIKSVLTKKKKNQNIDVNNDKLNDACLFMQC